MTTAALLFFATFAVVFLLGLQQLNVTAGLRVVAFFTSIGITAASLVLYKVLPGPTDAWQIAAHFFGGAVGIVASMWAHPHLVRQLGARAAACSDPLARQSAAEEAEFIREHSAPYADLKTMIADISARQIIESDCLPVQMGRLTWYDTDSHDEDVGLDNALIYLRGSGQLIEHPTRPELVRFQEGAHG